MILTSILLHIKYGKEADVLES